MLQMRIKLEEERIIILRKEKKDREDKERKEKRLSKAKHQEKERKGSRNLKEHRECSSSKKDSPTSQESRNCFVILYFVLQYFLIYLVYFFGQLVSPCFIIIFVVYIL